MQTEPSKRVQRLMEEKQKLALKLRQAVSEENATRRRLETRRKIIAGSIMLHAISEQNQMLKEAFIEGLKKASQKTRDVFPEYSDMINS